MLWDFEGDICRYLFYNILQYSWKALEKVTVIFLNGNYNFFIPYFFNRRENIFKTLLVFFVKKNYHRDINFWEEWKISFPNI